MPLHKKNFVQGFIILKNQKDTLKGTIDDQEWVVNPTIISFKSAANIEKSYAIEDLSSFGITGKESYLIAKNDLDITPFAKSRLQSFICKICHRQRTFLLQR